MSSEEIMEISEIGIAIAAVVILMVGIVVNIVTGALVRTVIISVLNKYGIRIPANYNYLLNIVALLIGAFMAIIIVAPLISAIVSIIERLFKASSSFDGEVGE